MSGLSAAGLSRALSDALSARLLGTFEILLTRKPNRLNSFLSDFLIAFFIFNSFFLSEYPPLFKRLSANDTSAPPARKIQHHGSTIRYRIRMIRLKIQTSHARDFEYARK